MSIVLVGLLGYFYMSRNTPTGDSAIPGVNFLSQFNPFKSNVNTDTGSENPGAGDTGGDQPGENGETPITTLHKVSNMPIAGFIVYPKERLKEIPPEDTTTGGESNVTTTPVEEIPNDSATSSSRTTVAADLKKKLLVTKKPIVPDTEFVTAVRYADRASGNIYQSFADKIQEHKFSGTVIPKIYDAYFGNNANAVLMRHLKIDNVTIETFLGTLPKEKLGDDTTTIAEMKGGFLTNNIQDVSVSPDGLKVFYLSPVGDGVIGTIQNLIDGKKNQIFNNAFTEWNSWWPNNNVITLTTKPSFGTLGYMYMIDIAKKSFTKVLGDINGLTTQMSPNGKLVLVGTNDLSLYVYHVDTKTYDKLGVKTLPEKCTWNKVSDTVYCAVPSTIETANYPDDWYRGEISFSDQIWKINLQDGSTTLIADPLVISGGEDTDGIQLAVDTNEDYLFFINKKDSFLWELELK